ncbi:MAG: exo-alpha-sialidase [Myxococcales bacterium]|nr:exo-alpha-sialidase [Myxococcales bacterium]
MKSFPPSVGRSWVVQCSMALVVLLHVPLAWSHSAVNSVHSLAIGDDGSRVMTVLFGLIHQPSGAAPSWVCPSAFGADQGALDRQLRVFKGAFYLVADGQLLKSDDNGCVWTAEKLPAGEVLRIAGGVDTLWALATQQGSHRLFRKKDQVWSTVPLPVGLNVEGIVAGAGALWGSGQAGDGSGTAFVSVDGGKTFALSKLPPIGFDKPRYVPLVSHPTQAAVVFVRATTELGADRLIRSLDGGKTWAIVFTPNPGVDVSSATWLPDAATGTLLVGGAVAGIWRSTDAGETFAKVVGAPRVGCLHTHKCVAYACTDDFAWGAALMASTDGGLTWAHDFCFASLTGAAKCASSCVGKWSEIAENRGIVQAASCGQATKPGPDATSAIDAVINDVDAMGVADVAAGPVVARAKSSGCSVATEPAQRDALLLLLLATSWMLVRRRGAAQ